MINDICLAGKIVPVEITVNLIKKAIEKNGGPSKQFLIDGFPRNQDNVDGWNKVMGPIANVKFILFLDCDENTMIERISKRGAAAGDQKRFDDNIETLRKRIQTNNEYCMPIVA